MSRASHRLNWVLRHLVGIVLLCGLAAMPAYANPLSTPRGQFDMGEYQAAARTCESLLERGENAPARLLAATARVAEGHFANALAHLEAWSRLTGADLAALSVAPAAVPDETEAIIRQPAPDADDSMPIRIAGESPTSDGAEGSNSPPADEEGTDEESESFDDGMMFWPDPTSMESKEQAAVVGQLLRAIEAGLKSIEVRIPADARRPLGNTLKVTYRRMVNGSELPEMSVPVPQDWSSAVSYTHLTLPTTPYV